MSIRSVTYNHRRCHGASTVKKIKYIKFKDSKHQRFRTGVSITDSLDRKFKTKKTRPIRWTNQVLDYIPLYKR